MKLTGPGGLRWEKASDKAWFAYSGELIVGQIGERDDGSCWYSLSGVNVKWVAKGSDLHVKSITTARRALERAWVKWIAAANLTPA